MTSSMENVASIFNSMADEYDDLHDVWYPHFFRSIETIIHENISTSGEGKRALDVGCGTGFQSYLLRSFNYEVVGIDIAADLIKKAKEKNVEGDEGISFRVGSATQLPFEDDTFDVLTCCGGVLSFIKEANTALGEIARVLKPGGRCIIEVDSRWNADLLWALGDHVVRGLFGFEQPFSTAWKNLVSSCEKGINVRYPFTMLDGSIQYMDSHFYTAGEIKTACSIVGMKTLRHYGIHSVSNLLPSTWLARADLPKPVQKAIQPLLRLDQQLNGYFPFRGLGNSLVLVLKK